MKTMTSAAVFAICASAAAFAQQPAPTTAGPAEIFTRLPAGTTVTNFYKQNVYDPADNEIGDVNDMHNYPGPGMPPEWAQFLALYSDAPG